MYYLIKQGLRAALLSIYRKQQADFLVIFAYPPRPGKTSRRQVKNLKS
jgi:hypothetical protein